MARTQVELRVVVHGHLVPDGDGQRVDALRGFGPADDLRTEHSTGAALCSDLYVIGSLSE